MKVLQEVLDKAISDLPEQLVADLLERKLAEQGVRLSRRQCEAMAQRVLKEEIDALELPWWRFWQYRRFRVPKNLLVTFTEEDSEKILAVLKELSEKTMPDIARSLIEEEPERFLAVLTAQLGTTIRLVVHASFVAQHPL